MSSSLPTTPRRNYKDSNQEERKDWKPETTSELDSDSDNGWSQNKIICAAIGLIALLITAASTPHLLDISKQGLRAKAMIPVFPVSSNHWSLMSGLYAESSGMVANNFWDPVTQSEFHYNQIESAWVSRWWLGEPMWETAGRAGIITANLMWPGPPKTTTGATPTYFVPWEHTNPPSTKQATKPAPNSALVNQTLTQVDLFAKNLHTALVVRNLTDIVDIVFVSDHGMTDTSHPEHIYIDDILGADAYNAIAHEDGWPSMGLRFAEDAGVNVSEIARESKGKFDVYTHETMPGRYHFSKSERIAPVYVVPKIGYVLTTHAEGDVGMSKGNHGYDNPRTLHACHVLKILHESRSSRLARLLPKSLSLSRPNKGWHSTSDDTYVMDKFENVQIYSLVMRLLGVQRLAPTNGSAAFWDKYF
ncbi:type I phosphodiesterase nucleotide pyrophosphatase [Favolaschia claudopus]|uniref:Type I phosphodiesterase nucleotide pyrophosphatase n=1 Tax=Favolaschia claudopus TaxID=2862362 RepID=A0AAW0D812_9AGAR